MTLTKNFSGGWSAFVQGPLRPIVVDETSMGRAMACAAWEVHRQKCEEYAMYESMSGLAEMGVQREDLG